MLIITKIYANRDEIILNQNCQSKIYDGKAKTKCVQFRVNWGMNC